MENLAKTKAKPAKVRPIARRRRNYIYLLLAILFAIFILYILKNFPPFDKIPIMNIGVPVLPIFFISLSSFIYSLFTFIFIKKTQGILISFFIILYLILRLLGLTHPVFAVIILVLFIVSEFIILRKK